MLWPNDILSRNYMLEEFRCDGHERQLAYAYAYAYDDDNDDDDNNDDDDVDREDNVHADTVSQYKDL